MIVELIIIAAILLFGLGFTWGRSTINKQTSAFYRTRRLSKKQQKKLESSLDKLKVHVKN